jgi:hypothetical protein
MDLTQRDEARSCTFEKKILCKIYGPVQDKGDWGMRYNQKLYQLYRSPDIIRAIKVARLRWAGHIQRMDRSEMSKRTMDCKLEGRRAVGRPKLRWIDGVVEDLRKLGMKSWWTVVTDSVGRVFYRKPMPAAGCRANDDDDDADI